MSLRSSVECVLLVDTASGRVVVVPPPALGGRGYSDSLLGHTLPSITVLDVDPRANRVLCSISAYTAPASVRSLFPLALTRSCAHVVPWCCVRAWLGVLVDAGSG